MNTKHTAGNWYAHDGQIYPEQNGVTLAIIPYFDKDNEEKQANAKLIAAAPDLLEALQNFTQSIDIICEGLEDSEKKNTYLSIKNSLTYQTANAAISKVTL